MGPLSGPFLHPAFCVFNINAKKLLHPLINYTHDVSQQVNHEEYK